MPPKKSPVAPEIQPVEPEISPVAPKNPPVASKLSVYETALRQIASKGEMERAQECVEIARAALQE